MIYDLLYLLGLVAFMVAIYNMATGSNLAALISFVAIFAFTCSSGYLKQQNVIEKFQNGKNVYLDKNVISKKNGWTYDDKVFTNGQKYVNISVCNISII